jgi:cGMP-dependent protein kinase
MGCNNSQPAGPGAAAVGGDKAGRRGQNVFASAHSAGAEFAKKKTPLMEKTPEIEALIKKALTENKLLAGLTADDMKIFCEYAEKKNVKANDVVIKEGEKGNEFYIIESGKFNVTKGGEDMGPLPVGSFGELALLFNAPRAASITASEDGIVWVIDRNTFRHGVGAASAKRRQETAKVLSKVPLLDSLTTSQLEHLADAVRPQAFDKNSEVFSKGTKGNIFYIITEGTFEFSEIDGLEGVVTKGPGEFFGEMALLTGDTRNATVKALTAGKVLALAREEFDSTVGPLKDLVKMTQHREMLNKIGILSNLDDVERLNAVRRFLPVKIKKGKVIIKEGQDGDCFFVISEGTVAITKSEFKDFTAEMGPGQFFGELALLDENDKRTATATAKTDVLAYYLSRKAFKEVVVGDVADVVKTTAAERQKKAKQDDVGTNIPFGDLETIATLGAGTFGRVSLVQDKNNKKGVYALKALHKSEIVQHKQEANVMNEKNIMIMCNHPFILRLYNTYKDPYKLYMLLEFCPGGELFTVLHTPTKDGVSPVAAKFYCAGCAMALGYLGDRDIMYRDLKPENMLVDQGGYPKVIDFGFAKISKVKTYTLCGTPEYMAPEIILGRGYDRGVDWWAFGVLLYECLAGYSPFCDPMGMNQQVICQNIVAGRLKFPAKGFDQPSKDLCKSLLGMDSSKRPGMGHLGGQEVLQTDYFSKFDFDSYTKRTMKAPWLPPLKSPTDASNFDPYDVDNTVDKKYKDVGNWDKDF